MGTGRIFLKFPRPIVKAKFINRQQRFLVEASLADGSKTVAYCANPGSFGGCLNEGSQALLWDSEDNKRKRRYTLRAVRVGRYWVGTDTHLANRVVERALQLQMIPALKGYTTWKREYPFGGGQRTDFFLTGPQGSCFLEVKTTSAMQGGIARFPDSITPRGLSHLKLLVEQVKRGHRGVLLFVIQRGDVASFSISRSHDPAYATAFYEALRVGVEALAYSVRITTEGFSELTELRFCKEANLQEVSF